MKIFKKNQILMFIAALALITTGYLAYKPIGNETTNIVSTTLDDIPTSNIGEAKLVSSSSVINEYVSKVGNFIEEAKEVVETVSKEADDYYASSRLERDKMYSQMLESYQKIIDNVNIPSEQKSIAISEVSNINNTKNALMIAENLIKTKGIQDVIIFINSGSVNVIIKANELTSDKVAQIQNIVSRELGAEVENIHISKK